MPDFTTLNKEEPDFALITDMAIHAEGSAFKALVTTLELMPRAIDKLLALHVALGIMEARIDSLKVMTRSQEGGEAFLRLAADVAQCMKGMNDAHGK